MMIDTALHAETSLNDLDLHFRSERYKKLELVQLFNYYWPIECKQNFTDKATFEISVNNLEDTKEREAEK